MVERFELPSELNIYSALEVRDTLLAWVAEHSAKSDMLVISAAAVAEVDGSGLQLLAALSNLDHPWRLAEPSDTFVEACKTLGLTQWIDKKYLQPSQERAA
jgi:anti-anti-sigma regulatory factor